MLSLLSPKTDPWWKQFITLNVTARTDRSAFMRPVAAVARS